MAKQSMTDTRTLLRSVFVKQHITRRTRGENKKFAERRWTVQWDKASDA